MPTIRQDASYADGRLDEVVVSFLEALESGQSPDPQEWLDRYPDLASELREFFADQKIVDRWTQPLREVAAPTVGFDPLATVSDSSRPGEPGTQSLQDYEILEEIARGGMGVVYKARHLRLNRIVALKMILAGPQISPADVHRFRLETEAVASLDHPNIMPVYEVGEHRGRPYFSMKLIDGGSLAEQLPRYSGDQRATGQLLAAVARGVHHAHQRGLLHRDLKPANILIDSQGQPYVTDFGLARRVAADSGLTQSGAIVGTPSYMAPEQAAGRKDLSTAADVYSLGAILYTMLTSRPPFRADTPLETVREVLEVEPSRPRLHRRDIDRDLETICLKCLEKQPQRRYGSAEALAEDLERWLAGEPIRARRSSFFERSIKRARKNPAGAALVAVSVLALAGLVAVGVVYQDQRARTAERKLDEQRAESQVRSELFASLSTADWHLARKEWSSAKLELEKMLAATRNRPALSDLRQRALQGLAVADHGLAEDQARQHAAAVHEQFLRDRDDVLLHGLLFNDVDVPANIVAARQAGAAALKPTGLTIDGGGRLTLDSNFTPGQAATIREECYTILLVLAEAALQQDPADHELALRLLERAGELDFRTQPYYERLARAREQNGDQAGAQQARELAAQTKPSGALDHFLLGADAAVRGNPDVAIAHFEAALDEQPDHFWASYFLAVMHLPARPDLSETLLRGLSQRSDSAQVCFLHAMAYRGQLDFRRADRTFTRALGLVQDEGSTNAELRCRILVNRGISRRLEKRYEEATADFAAAMEARPNLHQAYAELAYLLQEQDKIDAAVIQLDRAIEQAQAENAAGTVASSVVAKLYLNRARLDLLRDDFSAALHHVRLSIAEQPYAEAHYLQGNLAYRRGQFAEAIASYDAAFPAVAANPREFSPADAHRWKAQSLLALRRYDDALESLDAYFASGGRPDPEVYRLRGLARADQRDITGALSDYQRALELDPNDSLTLACRGSAYLVLGAHKPAEPDFRRAIELDAANRQAHYGLAYVLVSRGDVEEGAAHADDAICPGTTPLEAGLLLNAARIYGLMVTAKEQERLRLGSSGLPEQVRNRDRAIVLLRQGLEMLPAAERAAYWHSTVQPDYDRPQGAFWLFRNAAGFRELAAQYEQTAARTQ